MKLYEIDQAILDCIDFESGEIIDPEKLEELQIERQTKIENVALWIKNLTAEAEALKAEKEAFAEREKIVKNKIESLKNWLSFALDGREFNATKVKVSFRKSESVKITDEDLIPEEFIREKVERSPDKVLLKKVLKYGDTVPGCELELKNNIQIK